MVVCGARQHLLSALAQLSLKYRFICTFRGKKNSKKTDYIYGNFHHGRQNNLFSEITAVYHLQLR